MTHALTLAERLSGYPHETAPHLARLDSYYDGAQAAAFLAKEAREALGSHFRSLAVNFPRLVVNSVAERLTVTGFRTAGPDSAPDESLWRIWQENDLEEASAQAHVEALTLGRSFVIVWAGADGKPLVTVESARQVAGYREIGRASGRGRG